MNRNTTISAGLVLVSLVSIGCDRSPRYPDGDVTIRNQKLNVSPDLQVCANLDGLLPSLQYPNKADFAVFNIGEDNYRLLVGFREDWSVNGPTSQRQRELVEFTSTNPGTLEFSKFEWVADKNPSAFVPDL